jgi:hypothetical protein
MDVEVEEGEVNDDEKRFLLDGLAACAEESLGMVSPRPDRLWPESVPPSSTSLRY